MASFDELPGGADFVASLRVFRQLDWSQSWKYKEKIGFVDNELKFLTISVLTTLERDQPQDRVVSIVEIFDDFLSERN
eukprot:COSAG03_NODE_16126_length_411_cov_0.820513_1_plen_77_part_10